MHSCIYEGRVIHSRRTPIHHRFAYRLFMAYLDLDEMRDVAGLRTLLPARRRAIASFLATDHFESNDLPLDQHVRQLVADRTGTRLTGPIRLLTQLRHLGYYFSPLNLYYCFEQHGEQVDTIVAEVNNTPWGERHYYVLWQENRVNCDHRLRFCHAKAMHVSPFMDMDMTYHWALSVPGQRLLVHLQNRRGEERLFDASLSMSRRPLNRQALRGMCFRYPAMTMRIITAIHWQALRLWWKQCPVYSHPRTLTKSNERAA